MLNDGLEKCALRDADGPSPRNRHPRPDLDAKKIDVKQIFPDIPLITNCGTHTKEQTDGRISQTIFKHQSSEAKRRIFPGFSVRHRSAFDAPGLEEYCSDGKAYRLYKPH